MAKGLISDSTLTAIADAIRAKNGSEDTMLPSEMAGLIEAIESGGAEVYNGTISTTMPTTGDSVADLGVTLPESDNFIFIIDGGSVPSTSSYGRRVLIARAFCSIEGDLVIERRAFGVKSSSSGSVAYTLQLNSDTGELSLADGTYSPADYTMSNTTYPVYMNGSYEWIYAAW